MRARVVVVGGGVMGASIAWQLARRLDPHEEPVVLLEKQELAAGESGRSGAILRQFYSDRPVAAMARDSLRVYAGLESATGRSIGFMRSGVLTLASRAVAGQAELLERNVAMMRGLGIEVELLDAAGLRALVPGIAASDATVAAWEREAGAVDPLRTVRVLAALAREQGAVTRIGVRAEELLLERGRVVGVRTSEGSIECRAVVVATGPWTRPLLARAGHELPLRVVRPEQHFLAMPASAPVAAPSPASSTVRPARDLPDEELFARFSEGASTARAPHPVLLDLEHGFYARCELAAGRTRVGRMDYQADAEVADPDALDERVSDEFKRWARARLEARLPVYRAQPDHSSLAGMYTLTPDAQAVLGPLAGTEGLFVASGFSGHGFKLAPSIGEGLAQMVLGEPVSAFETPFFAPGRFAGAQTVRQGAFGL